MRQGVDLTNILKAAFTSADPKSTKRNWWLDCLPVILGSLSAKAVCKMLVKLSEDQRKDWLFSNVDFIIEDDTFPLKP